MRKRSDCQKVFLTKQPPTTQALKRVQFELPSDTFWAGDLISGISMQKRYNEHLRSNPTASRGTEEAADMRRLILSDILTDDGCLTPQAASEHFDVSIGIITVGGGIRWFSPTTSKTTVWFMAAPVFTWIKDIRILSIEPSDFL